MKLNTRRNFLLGVGAGAGLLLLMFVSMLPEALGREPQRKRIFFYAGAIAASAQPAGASGTDDLVVTDFSPLGPYRVRNQSGPCCCRSQGTFSSSRV